jgi:hypothetical protein
MSASRKMTSSAKDAARRYDATTFQCTRNIDGVLLCNLSVSTGEKHIHYTTVGAAGVGMLKLANRTAGENVARIDQSYLLENIQDVSGSSQGAAVTISYCRLKAMF